jgi:hypothetical protein
MNFQFEFAALKKLTATMCFLIAAISFGSANATERDPVSINDLTQTEFLAMALRLGASPDALADQIPLDNRVSQFEARRKREEKIKEIVLLAQQRAAQNTSLNMTLDSYVLFQEYDFDRQIYRLCLPQATYIENGHPKQGDPYLVAASVRFMALSTVSNCASKQFIAKINASEPNRHTMGLYIKLKMNSHVAEEIYNAVGGNQSALPVRFYCLRPFITHGQNITCGQISVSAFFPSNQLDLTINTSGFGMPETRWSWR